MQAYGSAATPVMWISNEQLPDAGAWWQRLHASRQETGLYPVLLGYPDGDLQPREPAQIDVTQYLQEEWHNYQRQRAEWPAEDAALAVPQGVEPWPEDPGPPFEKWPGLAPASADGGDADQHAAAVALSLAECDIARYVALVPVGCSAGIPAAIGWLGMTNHTGSRELSAVLRSWEDRFGTRVVGMAGASLYVSVAAPPRSMEQAQLLALEHYLLCPDNIEQNPDVVFSTYAQRLIGNTGWSFWWD
jgi:hypothetical protein